MKTFFKEIFEYTFIYNNKLLDSLSQNYQGIPEKSIQLINHTINAQEIWNNRILGTPVEITVWQIRVTARLKTLNEKNFKQSIEIIDKFDFDAVISYTNSQGEKFSNTVRDILFHIVNHSTYHRAQIATDCKLHDISPLISDYIFYKRK